MFNTPKQIFVPLIIGNEQKRISLVLEREYSGIYHILLDKEQQGHVLYQGRDWIVNTIEGSPIKEEHFEAIVRAITNNIFGGNWVDPNQ